MKTLFERFEVLEDARDIRGKKYKLIDILIMTWKSNKVSDRSDKRWKHTIYSISVFRRCGIINRSSKS